MKEIVFKNETITNEKLVEKIIYYFGKSPDIYYYIKYNLDGSISLFYEEDKIQKIPTRKEILDITDEYIRENKREELLEGIGPVLKRVINWLARRDGVSVDEIIGE